MHILVSHGEPSVGSSGSISPLFRVPHYSCLENSPAVPAALITLQSSTGARTSAGRGAYGDYFAGQVQVQGGF